jgi:phage shock protein C
MVVKRLATCIGMDPVLARVLYVLISVFCAAFPGILVYLILRVVIPEQ